MPALGRSATDLEGADPPEADQIRDLLGDLYELLIGIVNGGRSPGLTYVKYPPSGRRSVVWSHPVP